MEKLRPNEELLLMATVDVAELGEDDLQRLGLQKTVAVSYRYDGEGNVFKNEGDAVRDEELGSLVRVENYKLKRWLLKVLSLNNIEQVDIFPDDHTHTKQEKVRGGARKLLKNESKEGVRFPWGRTQKFLCGAWFCAECKQCGYKYWVRVPCGREYCPYCGKPRSLYHRRLYLQILRVLLNMFIVGGGVGYMVITCPEELREKWKDPNEMRKFVKSLRRKLKSLGLWPALYRWHWAGDRGRRWYPHLNLVFPLGYVEKEKLENLRRYLRRKGINMFHYQYSRSLKKLRHLARYVSRPTWGLQDEVSPERFKGFRKWGVWGKELLGIKGRIEPINEKEVEEFWLTLGVLISALVVRDRERVDDEELKTQAMEFLRVVKKEFSIGDGKEVLGKLEKSLESGGDIEGKVRRIVEKVLKMKGWPELRELAGLIVLFGRCVGCFQKLKFKWRKSPFITNEYKVYKLGWGVWVMVDRGCDDEEFPF
jgi:rubrerythrin